METNTQPSALDTNSKLGAVSKDTLPKDNVTVVDQQVERSQHSVSTISQQFDVPDFFLYTTLNQNQTKDLRKASSNRDERRVLAQIFNLNAIKKSPSDSVSRLDQIILDFHMINYEFCVNCSFSNEQISTLLAIFDFLLHTMVKRQLHSETGLKILKDILARHSLQRPPQSIFIFSEQEMESIVNFSLRTFFRHFSLYEYSFKPKVELVLMTLPKDGIPQTHQSHRDQMVQEINGLDIDSSVKSPPNEMGIHPDRPTKSTPGDVPPSAPHPEGSLKNASELHQPERESQSNSASGQKSDSIDWKKVGRIYKPESAIEDIVSGEVGRMTKALNHHMNVQRGEIEEKYLKKK